MRVIIGIVVGNILVWINTAILAAIYGSVLGFTILGRKFQSASEYKAAFDATITSTSLFYLGLVTIESLGALIAGYVAAAIAKRAELVCGLLATLSWVVASIPVEESHLGLSMKFRVSELVCIAIFGMLGGGLRRVSRKRVSVAATV